MKIKRGETDVKINVSFAACVTCMLILDESGVCALALFCCFVHEAAHLICMLASGEKPALVELSFYGIKLERRPVGSKNDILIYAAGPAANLLLWVILSVGFSHIQSVRIAAASNFAIGVFNLIPCRPLDGGNILFESLCRFMSDEKADRICDIAVYVFLAPLSVLSVYFAMVYGNVTLGGAVIYLAVVSFFDKREKGMVKL